MYIMETMKMDDEVPTFVKFLVNSGIFDYLNNNFPKWMVVSIFAIAFLLIFVVIINLIRFICYYLYKFLNKDKINENGCIPNLLGETYEEKYLNGLRIKKTKFKINIIVLILMAIFGLIMLTGINSGAIKTDLITFIAVLIIFYITYAIIYGTGIAWYIYSSNYNDYSPPSLLSSNDNERKFNSEEAFWIDYWYGPTVPHTVYVLGVIDTFMPIIDIVIGIAIGYWLGWFHELIHSYEIKEAKRQLKKKYKKSK